MQHAMEPISLEQGLRPLSRLSDRLSLADAGPYAAARALLLSGMERYSVGLSHALIALLSDPEQRRETALLCRVDAQQQAPPFVPEADSPCGRALLYALLSTDLCATLAQRMGECPLRQALHFVLPEFLDEMYRLGNLMMLTEKRGAERLLQGYAEIMPGRPMIACHRHPFDCVQSPLVPAGPLEEMAPLFLCALTEAKKAFLLFTAGQAQDALARGLYLECAQLAEQHATLFASLLPPKEPLDRLLLCQYAEGYLYDSCVQDEKIPVLRQLWLEEEARELSHIRKAENMLRAAGRPVDLPPFPAPLRLAPCKGYVREILQAAGVTARRDGYVPVGQLPPGADFFRYQQRVCVPPEETPSHAVVSRLIAATGSDYRYEIAPHPLEALRNRSQDSLQIGR